MANTKNLSIISALYIGAIIAGKEIPDSKIQGCPLFPDQLDELNMHCVKYQIPTNFLEHCRFNENSTKHEAAVVEILVPDKTLMSSEALLLKSYNVHMICSTSFFLGSNDYYVESQIFNPDFNPDWVFKIENSGSYDRDPLSMYTPGQLYEAYKCSWPSTIRSSTNVIIAEKVSVMWTQSGQLMSYASEGRCLKNETNCQIEPGIWLKNLNPAKDLSQFQQDIYHYCKPNVLLSYNGFVTMKHSAVNNMFLFEALNSPFALNIPESSLESLDVCKVTGFIFRSSQTVYRVVFRAQGINTSGILEAYKDKIFTQQNSLILKSVITYGSLTYLANMIRNETDHQLLEECKKSNKLKQIGLLETHYGRVGILDHLITGSLYNHARKEENGHIISCHYNRHQAHCLEGLEEHNNECIRTVNYYIRTTDLMISTRKICDPTNRTQLTELLWSEGKITIDGETTKLIVSEKFVENHEYVMFLPFSSFYMSAKGYSMDALYYNHGLQQNNIVTLSMKFINSVIKNIKGIWEGCVFFALTIIIGVILYLLGKFFLSLIKIIIKWRIAQKTNTEETHEREEGVKLEMTQEGAGNTPYLGRRKLD